ncbi:glycosyltransferase [Secundilactobacillus collinoides]|uniref:Rhamnosyltransferase n=1 Tax=Secundilactobacillus collinoides TaxID=33960 RepID=A0A166H3B7_SECCO|nr:glycosyltransferase [Secundilactobacillus collinoides]KZL41393.1 rhamnosyltransferase [Secundilactobacillus collinoides]
MNVGSVIVTYNPNIQQLRRNLDSVTTQVNQVIIVDNGSDNLKAISGLSQKYKNIEITCLYKNLGIAAAQNKGFSIFDKRNYDWILTLDQDSVISRKYVNNLLSIIQYKDAGIITGAYVDLKWTPAKIAQVRSTRTENIQPVNEEISSGNLVLLKAWKNVEGFDEKLFIDYVDFDFDYKLSRFGYRIYRVNGAEFEHKIGESIKKNWLTKILLLNNKDLFDHSAQRLFYMNRNRIIVRKRFPEWGSDKRMIIRELLNLREIIVMSGPRLFKFKKAISGIKHGVFYKDR